MDVLREARLLTVSPWPGEAKTALTGVAKEPQFN